MCTTIALSRVLWCYQVTIGNKETHVDLGTAQLDLPVSQQNEEFDDSVCVRIVSKPRESFWLIDAVE